MDLYITITKYTVKLVIAVSVEILFEKFVLPMNTQFDPNLITVAKMAVKLLFEVLIERIFETIMRQVQQGTQPRMEGMLGGDGEMGEGVDETDGIV